MEMRRKNRKTRKKKNVIIRGIREGEGGRKEAVEGVMKKIGVKVRIEEVRKIETKGTGKGDMVIVKVDSEEGKKNIMENK